MKKTRRDFLIYIVGSSFTSVAIGYLFPKASQSREVDIETLCSLFPQNSRCQNYLPGVEALDIKGKAIQTNTLLATAQPGIPIPVKGLPNDKVDYLIIKDGPAIAEYGIRPICTHLGCTVEWNQQKNHFICPCHGSQYDSQGRVVHGPAVRSLPLITVVVKQNQVRLVDSKPAIDPR
ncbi:Rieske [2Fe-2S] domain-containing protein [Nostoc sp. HK-01]|uniref:Rieske [2Fe-2S] domain-containing protein n=1 Tax=Anabaenopsis circularis NIES-21 TaxID=1085406 RepID=A0A1Z4GAU8_9CYAN|nr:Rieske [2Fe-2S] domain-containing protein [Anabaenopsis circularis NIES-21]BBD61051.1 Rieske [2Fe-2S] domain-containing protein [Nostoc sp. HK-01]